MRIWGRLFFYDGLLLKLANSSRGFPHELSSTVLQVKKNTFKFTRHFTYVRLAPLSAQENVGKLAQQNDFNDVGPLIFRAESGDNRKYACDCMLFTSIRIIILVNCFPCEGTMVWENEKTENINQSGVKIGFAYAQSSSVISGCWILVHFRSIYLHVIVGKSGWLTICRFRHEHSALPRSLTSPLNHSIRQRNSKVWGRVYLEGTQIFLRLALKQRNNISFTRYVMELWESFIYLINWIYSIFAFASWRTNLIY